MSDGAGSSTGTGTGGDETSGGELGGRTGETSGEMSSDETPEPFVQGGVSIDRVRPVSGNWRGGFAVLIDGGGFKTDPIVRIGNRRCTNLTRTPDGRQISCLAPRLTPGQVNAVQVVNTDGTGERLADGVTANVTAYVFGQNAIQASDRGPSSAFTNSREAARLEVNYRFLDVVHFNDSTTFYSLIRSEGDNLQYIRPLRVTPNDGQLMAETNTSVGAIGYSLCAGPQTLHVVIQGGIAGGLLNLSVDDQGSIGTSRSITPVDTGPTQCIVAQSKFVYVMSLGTSKISQLKYLNDNTVPISENNLFRVRSAGPMAVSPDGKFLVVGGTDDLSVLAIDATSGALSEAFVFHWGAAQSIVDLKFGADARTLYVANDEAATSAHRLYTFSLGTDGRPIKLSDIDAEAEGIGRFALTPQFDMLLMSFPLYGEVGVFSVSAGIPQRTGNSLSGGSYGNQILIY